MKDKVEKVLETQVRPILTSHGGDVELVEVTDDGIVKVKLIGGCCGCPSAQMTLKGLIETAIKSKIPEIKEVESV